MFIYIYMQACTYILYMHTFCLLVIVCVRRYVLLLYLGMCLFTSASDLAMIFRCRRRSQDGAPGNAVRLEHRHRNWNRHARPPDLQPARMGQDQGTG